MFTVVLARCVVLGVRSPGPLGSRSPVCWLASLRCVCGVLGHLAAVHRCARSVHCVVCAVSWVTWLLFTCMLARCVVLHGVCGVLGTLALVHWCACSLRCVACAESSTTWLLFTGVLPRCIVSRVRCLWPVGSCSPVCPPGALCCVCGVLGDLASLLLCARSVRSVACALSWATWLLFSGVLARCVVLRVLCPGPLGSCSPVCSLGVVCCVCGDLGHFWLLFTGVLALCVAWRVWCPEPLSSGSQVCPLGVLCCVCGVLGHLAPVHRCARSVRGVACAVPWATCSQFSGLLARCVVLRVRRPWPLGSCSPVCSLGALRCLCGALDHLAPVHRCVRSVRCVACAVSWATWLLLTGLPARCVVSRVRCPGPLGCCSPVCSLGALCCLCGVLDHLAPVHRCARLVCRVACAVSWTTWLLFTSVPARCVVSHVWCPVPLGPCSPVCSLGASCCVCGVLGHLSPVHWFARSVRCVVCAVSWATWLLRTAVPARCVLLRVRCPGPLGSCSPVSPLHSG